MLSALLYVAVAWLSARSRPVTHWLLTVLGILLSPPATLFAAYYLHLFDDQAWYYELRALERSELLAAGLGSLGGACHAWSRRCPRFRAITGRLSIPLLTILIIAIPLLKPILHPLDVESVGERWRDDVCLQTTPSTCGPCATATLLRMYGISATEQSLAVEARTSGRSTEVWYLLRALRRRGVQANVFIAESQPALLPTQGLAGVRLGDRKGAGHFIAILNRQGSIYTIADPISGITVATLHELQERYFFTGFFVMTSTGSPAGASLQVR
tara:strand:+ start:24984 stop:25796 length:813 start_codon:yes stop_codon:yes gene_type:complete